MKARTTKWLTLAEAAALAGRSERTMQRWLAAGRLEGWVTAGRTVVRRADVLAAVEPRKKGRSAGR